MSDKTKEQTKLSTSAKEIAKKKVRQMVKDFQKAHHLNEGDTESKWIEPLMEALGWKVRSDDVSKKEQLSNNYTDYTFKINGHRKFVLEAKKIGLSLDGRYESKTFAEQALDYAKHADCTWAVLTNFQEFRVYSTDKKDDNGLIYSLSVSDYSETEFERLWYFSKESMSKGELNSFGEQWGFKTKKAAIDKILLEDMLHFREILAKDIRAHNERLRNNIDLCDEIVQKLLDRFIFIRNCEDIEIEHEKLISLAGSKNIIRKLRDSFSDKNRYGYYNSNLFANHECDKQTIHISDAVLSEIIEGLYESPKNKVKYQFSEINSDVLGSVYEQYLSHLLRKRKQGGLDESFSKKKQQGIYYTPTYIVDYIVNNTLGKLLSEKGEKQIDKVEVLDMACGSGSFLIKCYDVFENAYLKGDEDQGGGKSKHQLALSVIADRKKSLRPIKKCEIISKNIYGIDLDKQAVEISQLNLMLKIKQKVKLPIPNIKCGDSLLDENGAADYATGLFEELSTTQKAKFDVIVGNPPYVDIKELHNTTVKKLFTVYHTVENRMNLYSVFIERALDILKPGGYFGFIIPNSILYNESYTKIRKLLLENVCLKEIVRLPDNVFEKVKVETIILIFQKDKAVQSNACKVLIYNADDKIDSVGEHNCSINRRFKQTDWIKEGIINLSLNRETKSILKNIEKGALPLEYYCDFSLGLTPYDKYKGHTEADIEKKVFHSDKAKTKFHKPLIGGGDITRYGLHWPGNSYIKYGNWLGASREQRFFTDRRIIVRQIICGDPQRIYAAYSNKEFYNPQSAFTILVKELFAKEINIKYILGVFNSNLISYYHREKFIDSSKILFQKILIANARKFPIHFASKAIQTRIAELVDTMIALENRLHNAGDEISDRTAKIIRQMEITDKKLNEEVYKVYGLTKPESDSIDETFSVSATV